MPNRALEPYDALLRGMTLGQPVSQQELTSLHQRFPTVEFPRDYIEFLQFGNGAHGWLSEKFVVLYPVDEVIAATTRTRIEVTLPNVVLIGTTGGGHHFACDSRLRPASIVDIPEEDVEPENVRVLSQSFREFVSLIKSGLWSKM